MDFREQQEFIELRTLNRKAKKSMLALRSFEEVKDKYRTEYQKDIDRILYSEPFRRLKLKTHAFMSRDSEQQNRTRLSHTMEVTQLAKTIAKPLSLNCDLVEAISYGQDIGQMPFGNAGGRALDKILRDRGKSFNHNVQSVWIAEQIILNRLDMKGESHPGFNLTSDTLEGIWKHNRFEGQVDEYKDCLNELNPHSLGSLESQIVQLADSLSYCLHDLYDADANNIVSFKEFENDVWNKHFSESFDSNRWHYEFIYDLIENNDNCDEISFSSRFSEAFDAISRFISERVRHSRKVLEYDEISYNIISEIFNYYDNNIDLLLRLYPSLKDKYKKYGKERVIVDYIQWFGDAKAIMEFEKIRK